VLATGDMARPPQLTFKLRPANIVVRLDADATIADLAMVARHSLSLAMATPIQCTLGC